MATCRCRIINVYNQQYNDHYKIDEFIITYVWLYIAGSHVKGQIGFPSGITVNCYGTDSTCTGSSNEMMIDYGDDGEFDPTNRFRINPCCFEDNENLISVSQDNFYTVSGGTCQSCAGDK